MLYEKKTIVIEHVLNMNYFFAHLFQPAHVDILWRHEEDGGQRSSVHLSDGDGEDKEPGEDTGYRVDHSQDGVPQEKPKVSADAPLQRFKDKQTQSHEPHRGRRWKSA